jgi:hypothetical protein
MRLLTAKVTSNCDIALQGDDHEGSQNFVAHAVDGMLDWASSAKSNYFVKMGDVIEAIASDDKRFHIGSTKEPLPLRQANSVIKRHKKHSKKCLAWLSGNHEDCLHRVGDLGEYMAEQLNVQFAGRVCKLRIEDKHGLIAKLFLIHPERVSVTSNAKDYEQRVANMKASVKVKMVQKACDCLLMAMAHIHKLIICDPAQRLVLADDGKEITQKYLSAGVGTDKYIEPDRRWYLATGSMLKLHGLDYDGYAERAMYDPVELGYPVVEIRDRKIVNVRKELI